LIDAKVGRKEAELVAGDERDHGDEKIGDAINVEHVHEKEP
jgi:hypothetical protein